jgi:hypothetical protein
MKIITADAALSHHAVCSETAINCHETDNQLIALTKVMAVHGGWARWKVQKSKVPLLKYACGNSSSC